jgi:hypothetical protein
LEKSISKNSGQKLEEEDILMEVVATMLANYLIRIGISSTAFSAFT